MDFVGFEKVTLLDYEDKVASILFFNKCNFRCPFCHNGLSVINATSFIPFQEIVDYLSSRKGIIDGVVISGGEPTLMDDLVSKIKIIRDLGFSVKLDTNGSNPEMIKTLLKLNYIDYIAMDIKNSPEKYAVTCGLKELDFTKIKESINIIMNSGLPYEFRTTVMEEFHDEKDMEEIGQLIAGCRKMYLQKYTDRDTCFKHDFHAVPLDKIEEYKKILNKTIDNVELRGY